MSSYLPKYNVDSEDYNSHKNFIFSFWGWSPFNIMGYGTPTHIVENIFHKSINPLHTLN